MEGGKEQAPCMLPTGLLLGLLLAAADLEAVGWVGKVATGLVSAPVYLDT